MKKLLTLTFILSLFSLSAMGQAGESESTPLGAEHCADDRQEGKVTSGESDEDKASEATSSTKK